MGKNGGGGSVTLDTVMIKIETESGKAASNIGNLAKNLENLKNSIKGARYSNLNKLSEALERLVPSLQKLGSTSNISESIANITNGLSQLKSVASPTGFAKAVNSLEKFPEVINKIDTKTFENLKRVSEELSKSLEPLADKMDKVAQGYSAFSKIQNTFGKSATTVTRYAKQEKSILGELSKTISRSSKSVVQFASGLTNAFGKKSINNLKSFHSKFKQVYLSLLGTRTLFTMIRKAASEYMNFDQTLQKFSTNVWRAFGAQLAPALEYAMYLFKQFVRVIYSVIYALTGIDLIARANAKAMQGWSKAAKDTLGNLQKFDDLNVVEFPKGKGDDELIEMDKIDLSPIQKVIDWVKKLKEEIQAALDTGEWYNVGKVFAKGISEGIVFLNENIRVVRNTLFGIAYDLADMLNGAIENTNWGSIGEFITNALIILPDIITEFLRNVHWDELGKGINELFRGLRLDSIVHSFMEVFKSVVIGFGEFLAELDWSIIGPKISDALVTFFSDISDIIDVIPWLEIGRAVREAIENIEWDEVWDNVLKGFKEAIKGINEFTSELTGIDTSTLGAIETALVGIGVALTTYKIVEGFDNLVTSLSKFKKVGTVLKGIPSILGKIGTKGKSIQENPLLNGDILKVNSIEELNKKMGKSTPALTDTMKSAGTLSDKAKNTSGSFKITDTKTILSGIGSLTLIIGALTGLIVAMGALTKIPGFTDLTSTGIDELAKIFVGLAKIMIPVGIFSAGIVVLGKVGIPTVLKGIADLAIIMAGLTGLITAIGFVLSLGELSSFLSGGIEILQTTFNGLSDIILPLGVMSALVVGLGFATPAVILSGMIGLAAVIGGLEIILVALGALKQIPGFEWIVGEGGKVLSQLGTIIGEFGGSIIAGLADKAFESLDSIGTHLSNFMNNADDFFKGVAKIKEDSAKGVKYIADAILTLGAANVLDAIGSWLTGDTSLSHFGKELAKFAPYLMEYANKIKGLDGGIVTASANAAKALSELASNLPNQGGLVSWFTGDNTIDKFGAKLPSFGKNLKSYSDKIKGVDSSVVENSAIAAGALAELASNLPNQGGIVSWFTGDNTIDKFGEKLEVFGRYFKSYYDHISGINTTRVNNVTNGLEVIVDILKDIKKSELSKTIDSFGNALSKFGPKINSFFSDWFSTTSGTSIGETFGKSIGSGIVKGIKKNATARFKLTNSGGGTLDTYKLTGYASGGFPESGQYFFARENGMPEYVGSIGSKTAVANNNQIIEGIKQGVLEALSENSSNNSVQPLNIYIGNKKIYECQQAFNKTQQNKYGTIDLY